MKILAINGSPRGRNSNTNIMVTALLKGAESAGAETENIFLSEKNIQQCRGCHTCWFKTPGQCAIDDDAKGVLDAMGDADIILFATPVYVLNISGTLKTLVDRLTAAGGNPHKQEKGSRKAPKYIMLANCGFAARSQFDVVSLWINQLTAMVKSELVAEIYAPEGNILSRPKDEQKESRERYLNMLEECGREIAAKMELTGDTKILLEKSITGF
jgi:multimeric flavodoxin WrbA